MFKKWLLYGSVIFVMLGIMTLHVQGRPAAAATTLTPPVNQIIVQFSEEVTGMSITAENMDGRIQQLSEATGVALQYGRSMSGNAHVLKLPTAVPVSEAEAIAATIARQEGMAYAEPDYIRQAIGDAPLRFASPLLTPNDPSYGNQWHYGYTAGSSEGLNLPAAWNINTGSASTVVAVIDTGILPHADLAGRTVSGYDFISNAAVGNDGDGRDSDPSDPGDWVTANECGYTHPAYNSSWHGTHVAGTIGAATNNNLGVSGINWNAKILAARVLGKCGGNMSDIVDAMRWSAGLSVSGVPANANPAKVLNLSLGGSGACSTTEQNAINEIVAAGSTIVIAAGNDSADASGFSPGNCNNIITVAANDRTGNKAWYSNYGSIIEVTAPGGETATTANGVLSTLDGGATTPLNDNTYAYYQGTSMAAPHVAGVVSLVIAEHSGLTPAQISQHLQSTARAFPAGSSCNTSICGAGIVDAYNALSTAPTIPTEFVYLPLVSKPAAQTPSGPTPGFWESPAGHEFYVTTDRSYVDNFAIYISVTGCGNYKITHLSAEPITNDQFSFSGSFYASGAFSSSTNASGTDGLSNFDIPGCGIVTGGPWSWSATWQDSSQPTFLPAEIVGSEAVEPAAETGRFVVVEIMPDE
jgi:serine protease